MPETSGVLAENIRALIGKSAEKVEASLPWGIEREGLRTFTNAIMDPDPRYWDDEFAKTTKFGGIVTPPIYASYVGRKTPPGTDDPVTAVFKENPNSDGLSPNANARRGDLPPVPTNFKRVLNAGNEIELISYPTLGDRIFAQSRYSNIEARTTKEGVDMLIITVETTYTNQKDQVLCILRQSAIRR